MFHETDERSRSTVSFVSISIRDCQVKRRTWKAGRSIFYEMANSLWSPLNSLACVWGAHWECFLLTDQNLPCGFCSATLGTAITVRQPDQINKNYDERQWVAHNNDVDKISLHSSSILKPWPWKPIRPEAILSRWMITSQPVGRTFPQWDNSLGSPLIVYQLWDNLFISCETN